MAKVLKAACIGVFCILQWSPASAAEMVSVDTLQRWHVEKANGGPTFSGSPAWLEHMAFVEAALRERGVVDLTQEDIDYRRWFASDDLDADDRSLAIDGRAVPVASYWAYSGSTDAEGVTAPLIYYQRNMPAETLRDRIVVFDVSTVPASMQSGFKSGYEYANYDTAINKRGIASDQWFQGNYVIRFGKFDVVLKEANAAGAVVIFDMSPERAAGLYTFPLLRPGIFGVPGLYVDRVAGATVREAAKKEQSATLVLEAKEEDARTYFLYGALPGRNYGTPEDEMVLLVTHSEGPNLTQENGTIGIVGIVDYFSQLPQKDRNRTLLVLFDPQHYMPGRHLVHWYADHPEIVSRIVASVGVEQLGQLEYSEDGDAYGLNGLPEPTLIFAQENDRLVEIAVDAVKKYAVPRAEVRVPSRDGQGMWQGLGDFAIKHNVPGFAISSAMSGYWTTTPGIESFDKTLCYKQVGVLIALTQGLMDVDLDDIAVPFVDPAVNPALSPGVAR
jgi:hypothetical protein